MQENLSLYLALHWNALQSAEMSLRQNFDLSVYFILDPSLCGGRDIEDVARAAVRGGVTMVQLRNKSDDVGIVADQARMIQAALVGCDVPFIINDHVELAAEIGADGVHIGQGDLAVEQARSIIGDDKIIGLTAFTRVHYDAIDPVAVDYVGTGPVFPTLTDKGKPVLGVQKFTDLIVHAPVAVVGIGGITADNAQDVIGAGAQGVAMMRSVSEADDVEAAARAFGGYS